MPPRSSRSASCHHHPSSSATRNNSRPPPLPSSSRDRLSDYNEKVTGVSQVDRDRTIPALALRSYHLPGNGWCEDYIAYLGNNHPVFGICCHHRLHPVGRWSRIFMLLGSVAFGLLVTNVFWLWFHYHDDETMITISLAGNNNNGTAVDTAMMDDGTAAAATTTDSMTNATAAAAPDEDSQDIEITMAMILLWTVGGVVHAIFDNVVWYLTACVCCLPGQRLGHLGEKYKRWGSYVVTLVVVFITALTTFIVVLRAVIDSSEDDEVVEEDVALSDLNSAGIADDQIDFSDAKDPNAYRFLISYAIELALALFVYYPLFATVLFSGILGCGKVPVLGGRPYEVMCEQKERAAELGDGDLAMCTDLAVIPRRPPKSSRTSRSCPV